MAPDLLQEEAAVVALLRGNDDVPKMRPRDLRSCLDDGLMPSEVLERQRSGLFPLDPDALHRTLEEISSWRAGGIRVMFPFSTDYPQQLLGVYDYPLVLFGTGTRTDDTRTAAIVGSRTPSAASQDLAWKLAHLLAAAGVTIASGLARGVDTVAHRAALDAGGRTVAVLGHGAGRVYPKENAPLLESIRSHGGEILTQFWPGSPPTRQTFPMRNVTMSGLSAVSVIVEAAEESGTRHQAHAAVSHGHYVMLQAEVAECTSWGRDMVARRVARPFRTAEEAHDLVLSRLDHTQAELAFG